MHAIIFNFPFLNCDRMVIGPFADRDGAEAKFDAMIEQIKRSWPKIILDREDESDLVRFFQTSDDQAAFYDGSDLEAGEDWIEIRQVVNPDEIDTGEDLY